MKWDILNNFELLKTIGALIFFFITLMVISYLRYEDKIDKKQFVILLMGMLAIMGVLLGVGIDWKRLKAEVLPTSNHESSEIQTSAYGLKINKIVWKNYYFENYDFKGEIEYFVENISNISIVDLPLHIAHWSGWNVSYELFNPIVYGNNRTYYTLEQSFYKFEIDRTELDGSRKEVTSFNWQLRVNPSLEPKQSLHYGIIVKTNTTERDAFTENGSFAGMSSLLPVDTMICEIVAPQNYFFNYKDYIIRDRKGNTLNDEVKRVKKPEFLENGRKIIWEVEKPIPTARYLVGIQIVKSH